GKAQVGVEEGLFRWREQQRAQPPAEGTAEGAASGGGRQGPSEDTVEPWPHVLHCIGGRAAGVSARRRVDDAPGDTQCHDAFRRNRDV
ncbi:MAG: hypothetical protein OXC68_00705, partial [Aestuariivita sp.]|nr:hypothetical protein [Aestuariivita sp.]